MQHSKSCVSQGKAPRLSQRIMAVFEQAANASMVAGHLVCPSVRSEAQTERQLSDGVVQSCRALQTNWHELP
jgi:hypothetical protein